MIIKIINENPVDIVDFMIKFLEEEESEANVSEFKNALSKTVLRRKVISEQMSSSKLESGYFKKNIYPEN